MSSVCVRPDDCSLIHIVFVSCLLADSLIVHGNRSLIGFMITHRSSTEKNNGRQATSLLRCGQPSRTETACNDCVVRKVLRVGVFVAECLKHVISVRVHVYDSCLDDHGIHFGRCTHRARSHSERAHVLCTAPEDGAPIL